MQCKRFSSERDKSIEETINKWLKDNPESTIKFISQSESAYAPSDDGSSFRAFNIMIWYE